MDKNFSRLLDTLAILQRSSRLSTPEIQTRLAARGHQVTPRTVQRDLEALSAVYPLECDQRTRPFAWSWRKSAERISLPGMDWPEAVSFNLLSSYLDGVLPGSVKDSIQPYVEEARQKLTQHFDKLPLRRWPERVRVVWHGQQLLAPQVSRSVHLAVTEAVLLGQRLRIHYKAFVQSAAKTYLVSPLGLVQSGAAFYVPVRFDGHHDVRTIALHRIRRAEIVDAPSGIEQFSLDEWLAKGGLGFGGHEEIQLVIRLFDRTVEILTETPLSRDQTIASDNEEGTHLVRATVLDTVQLRRWLLSMGHRVEVVAPASLRAHVTQVLVLAVKRYTG